MQSPSRSPNGNTGVKGEEDRNAIYAWKHNKVLFLEQYLGPGAFQVGIIDGYRLGRFRVSDGIAGRVGVKRGGMEGGGVRDEHFNGKQLGRSEVKKNHSRYSSKGRCRVDKVQGCGAQRSTIGVYGRTGWGQSRAPRREPTFFDTLSQPLDQNFRGSSHGSRTNRAVPQENQRR